MTLPKKSEPWYKDGLRFSCSRCGDCCRGEGYVWVNEDEIERLASFLGLGTHEFGSRYLRRVDNDLSLIDKPSLDCIFWDQGCTVYPARPGQCRTFPFWQAHLDSEASWKRVQAACPGAGSGRHYHLVEIGALAKRAGDT